MALSSSVTYTDLEHAPTVVLAGLDPEDEAGTIFLRLRKASRGPRRTRVVALAPFASRGLRKMGATLVPTRLEDETRGPVRRCSGTPTTASTSTP